MRLHLFNPDTDMALADGRANYLPPSSAHQMALDLAILPMWYAMSGDGILAASAYNDVFFQQMKVLFNKDIFLVTEPEVCEYDNITPMSAGGEPAQIFYMSHRGLDASSSISVPMARYVVSQMSWIIVGIVAVIFIAITKVMDLSVVLIIGLVGFFINFFLLSVCLILSMSKKIGNTLVVKVLRLLQKMHIIKNYEKQYERLAKLAEHGRLVAGGERNPDRFCIAPTVIDGISRDDPLMEREIFGPILPVLEFHSEEELLSMLVGRPKPLALYCFGGSRAFRKTLLAATSSGAVVFDDVVMHFINPGLPFGGVGASGIGRYHGKYTFDTFTHYKPVMKQSTLIDWPVRYPPFTGWKRKLMSFLTR